MSKLSYAFTLSSLSLFVIGCGVQSEQTADPGGAGWELEPVPSTFSVCVDGSGDYSTIQDAIDDVPSGAIVSVCAGVYAEKLSVNGKALALVSADGIGAAVLDGGGADRILLVEAVPAPGLSLTGFTLQDGASTYNGGAIYAEDSILTLVDNSFVGNTAAGDGAGLFARDSQVRAIDNSFEANVATFNGGGAELENCGGRLMGNSFVGNEADDGGGLSVIDGTVRISANSFTDNVAIDLGGGIYLDGDAPLENNVISDNDAGDDGGGFYLMQGAGLVVGNTVSGNWSGNDGGGAYTNTSSGLIAGNTFTDNVADDDAGGLRIYVGTSLIVDNTFSYNTAADAGGGVKLSHAQARFLRNTVVGNVTGDRGGGVELDNDTTTVQDCAFSGNQAAMGAGLHSMNNHSSQRIERSSFVDNVATTYGGGIMLETDGYTVTLSQLDFAGNEAPRGGALHALEANVWAVNLIAAENTATTHGGAISFDGSSGSLSNVVAWGNTAPAGAGLYMLDIGTTRISNSIISENIGVGIEASGVLPSVSFTDTWGNTTAFAGMSDPTGANGNIAADPLFVDPVGHDFSLAGGSPAIDAGVPFLRDDDGSRADMGAYGGPYGSW